MAKKKQKINKMNVKSNKQLLFGHSLLHKWWNNPQSTFWNRSQIKAEHTRLVKIMLKRGINHNSPLI